MDDQFELESEEHDVSEPPERLAAAYERTLTIARALPESEVVPLRVDARLAALNARDGYAIIEPHLPELKDLPRIRVETLARIPDLGLGLIHSVRNLKMLIPDKGELARRLARGRLLRYAMLHQAQAASALGLLPEATVEKILKGKGLIDMTDDLISLSKLFTEHAAALSGRSVLTDELLIEAEQLGVALEQELRPVSAPKKVKTRDEQVEEATSDRNRIWTLLVSAHAELDRAASYLGLRVPSLQARRRVKKKAAEPAPAEG